MASNAKDIQLRELKDTVSQLKTMIAEQTELIKALRLIIDEKTSHEKACLLYTSPSPRDAHESRMPSSA